MLNKNTILTKNEAHINYQRIEKAIRYLEQNFQLQPDLDKVAEEVHLSPFHFQRVFSEWAGISPKRFLQFLTVEYLKEKLAQSRNLVEAAETAGLSAQSRVYDLFTTLEGVTPQEYKDRGAGIRIDYGYHDSPFGNCLVGVTERGICWLSFLQTDEDPRSCLESMKNHWYNSVFHEGKELTSTFVDKIFSAGIAPAQQRLHVFVKGTNFQLKVWNALLQIPMGNVTTYQELARSIQKPKAMQAVGSAVGANHVAFLIPCHRVIRTTGVLGEYRWTSAKKKTIIGWEFAKTNPA